jgi:hypothetical protein
MPWPRAITLGWSAALATALAADCGGKSPTLNCFAADDAGFGKPPCDEARCWRPDVGCTESCNGQDQDRDADGLADCQDPDCWAEAGTCKEACDGKAQDEDGDGLADCKDSDCWVKGGTCKEACSGGHDEDADGQTDCADSDCWVKNAGCKELCSGGHDEDADGQTDCGDSDCATSPSCVPSFAKDAAPIFLKRCAGQVCHNETVGAGGMIADHYDDMLKPAIYCSGQTKGWCAAYRIQEGSMPKDCPMCVPQKEADVIQAWVDGGLLP